MVNNNVFLSSQIFFITNLLVCTDFNNIVIKKEKPPKQNQEVIFNSNNITLV